VIKLDRVTKVVGRGKTAKAVFRDMSITLPTDRRLAILGLPGSGKTTLISLLAGIEKPGGGTVSRYSRLSYPVGYARTLRMALSMRLNAKFTARIYGCDPNEVSNFLEKALGLEAIFDIPMKRLPARDKFAFAYALTYTLPFDSYLIDGNLGGPPGPHRTKILALCEARSDTSGMIFATSHVHTARKLCDMAAIIVDKRLVLYEDIEEAFDVFQELHDKHSMEAALSDVEGAFDEIEEV